jgi:predicted ATPase/class 3 adenylate cyclase
MISDKIMADLPTGTVTFLFTDIEGSTRLLRALGDGYGALQDLHAEIMRGAIEEEQGHEVRTEGDSFFVVFRSPLQAVRAAVAAQRGLTGQAWSHGSQLRVRMGLHTGEGVAGGDDYVGIDVNRAARIAAVGHGGQVLISDATRALMAGRLPEGVRVQTLGSYRLKDLPGPERLHQLEIAGLPSAFPPLRALDVRRAHLPPEATSFIGRGPEIEALARLLTQRRLITLTGPGGSGKTRLALRTAAEVADRFADGAFFVAVASIGDPELLPGAIASELNLPEDRARPIADVLRGWLGERELLLLLDNLEQIEGAGHVVDDLLTSAPGLHVLATSRAPLKVSGEQEFPVPPFSVPAEGTDVEVLEASEVVQLFVDRARLVRPGFSPTPEDLAVITDICRRLDGLPLAIELAAARVRLLSPAAIQDRFGRRLDALVGGPSTVPDRQQSLRAAIAWSHDLLDQQGKALFRRLATFVGGWTIDAAAAVCAGSPVSDVEAGLDALALQSLIQSSPVGDEPRFTMLETIGEFAKEQLEAIGETSELMGLHTVFFRQLAEDALTQSEGPAREDWFDRLEVDLDNLRAAIDRAAGSEHLDEALGIAAALRPFWLQRNHSAEGLVILVTLSDRAGVSLGAEFAAATAAAAAIATWLGDYAIGRRMGELSVTAYRRLGDQWGLAEALGSFAFATIEVDVAVALALNHESLTIYRDLGDIRGEGQALLGRATAQFALGRLSETRESVERSLELLRQAGDHYFALFSSIFLGRIKLLMGDIAAGLDDYRAVLETSRALDLRIGIAVGLEYFGEVAVWAGDLARAVRLGATAERLKEELGGGVPPRMGGALEPLVVGRSELSPAEFDREAGLGRAMDIDSAIAEALATKAPKSVPSAASSPGPATPP